MDVGGKIQHRTPNHFPFICINWIWAFQAMYEKEKASILEYRLFNHDKAINAGDRRLIKQNKNE